MHQPLASSAADFVSVVIPTYNSSKFLAVAIESAIAQTHSPIEIIVVDDGSSDDTKVICDRYLAVKYIYQSNQGAASARNTGLRASQGSYLVFLDSDDYLFPEAIEIGLESLAANPSAGFVFGSYLFRTLNPDGSYGTQQLAEDPPAVASYRTILAGQHKIQAGTVMLRRLAIESVGGFDPSLAVMEDLHLFLSIARTWPIDFHDRVVSEYRYHGGNISSGAAKMLIGTLAVHSLEQDYVRQSPDPAEAIAYTTGHRTWLKFFGDRLPYEIMRCVQAQDWVAALGYHRLLLHYDPDLESIDREIYQSAKSALFAALAELPWAAERTYWQGQLAGGSGLLALPVDRPRSTQPTGRGQSTPLELSPESIERLQALSHQQGVDLETILLTALKILLYRYTGATDIIVGTPVSVQIDRQVSVNAIAVRSNLADNPTVVDLLQQVHQTQVVGREHAGLPLELIEGLRLHVTMVFGVNGQFDQIDLDRLTATPWTMAADRSTWDLTLYINQTSTGLEGQWIYSSDLFDSTTIDRLNRHFHNLLAAIVIDPHQSIAKLPLLTEDERQQLLGTCEPSRDSAQPQCLQHLFEAQAALHPDRIAVRCADQQLTYQELNDRANQLAHYLQSLGVTADRLVGLCVERSLDTVIGILGILKAGGAYVPIDPHNPPARSAHICADAQVEILVTQSSLVASLTSGGRPICLDTDLETIAAYPTTNLVGTGQPADLAYAIYTSGSTGQPKGVLVTHQNVARLFTATAEYYHFQERDVWTLFHSCAFDFSVWELWGALLHGGRLVVVPYFVSRDPVAFYHLLISEQVTVLNQTPAAFYQLSKIDQRLNLSQQLSLRLVIFGGEALNLASLEPWLDRHGDTVPQLVNMYGITETTVHVTYQPLTRADLQTTGSPIGRPIADLQVYVLDTDLQPVPIGVVGEMYVGGAGVARGYWRREDLTRERFIPHPFRDDPAARLYKTGDLAKVLADGRLEYIGRSDNQVKIRGFRIELGEIEAALSQHPDLTEAVAIVREDLPGDRRLVAYLTTQNHHLTTDDLRDFLAQRLPSYMIPTLFAIVAALPLTVNGKVDRRALLADRVASQPIDSNRPQATDRQTVTATNAGVTKTATSSTETVLIAIWSQVLGRSAVGIHDNFFELGGHSISILQVAAAVQQQLGGIEIPVVKLFQYPTIAKLAAYLSGEQLPSQSNSQLKQRAEQQRAATARRRQG